MIAKSVGIDNNNFTLNSYKHFKRQFKKIKIRDVSLDCIKLREIKTKNEIQNLTKSCSMQKTRAMETNTSGEANGGIG